MIKLLFATLLFISRLPVPARLSQGLEVERYQRSIVTFPLVGLLLGAIASAVALLLQLWYGIPLVTLFGVLMLALLTDGFHLDGLADTCDDIFSARIHDRMLEIIRDSRLSTYGELALIFVLMARMLVVGELLLHDTHPIAALAAAYAASRRMVVLLMYRHRYARGKRLGNLFIGKVSLQQTLVTMTMGVTLATVLLGLQGLRAALITLMLIQGLGWALKRTLSGQTGDTLGAAVKLGELLFLLALLQGLAPTMRNRMETLSTLLAAIPQPDVTSMARVQQHIDGLLKPPDNLDHLETLAVQLVGLPKLQGQLALTEEAIMVVYADHNIWHEGVTPSPQVMAAIRAGNMVRSNTGVCVLAVQAGAKVQVVDVGIDTDPLPDLVSLKMARGSGNIARTVTVSRQQAETVLLASIHLTRQLTADRVKVFGIGELGVANTTPAAAVISVPTGSDSNAVVDYGANLPLVQRGHKVAVVHQTVALNQPSPEEGLDVLMKVGGYGLVDMIRVILEAASCGLPVMLDGFLSYVSALVAYRMAPTVHSYLAPSHLSAGKRAQIALDALDLRPYLDMDMRLGEDSGTALAIHLLEATNVVYNQMGMLAQSNIVLPNTAPSS